MWLSDLLVAICIKNDDFCIQNDDFCIQNDCFYISNDEFNTNDDFCIQNDDFCIQNDWFYISNDEFNTNAQVVGHHSRGIGWVRVKMMDFVLNNEECCSNRGITRNYKEF